jgi:hypothetical protein
VNDASLLKIAALTLLAGLLLVPCVSAVQSVISVPYMNASPGSEITIPVSIQDANGIGALLFNIRYGTLLLTYVSTEPGTLKPDAVVEAREITPGVVEIGVIDSKGITGSGTVAQMKFKVTGDPGSSTSMNLAVLEAYDATSKSLNIGSRDGEMMISGPPVSGSPGSPSAAGTTPRAPLEPLSAFVAVIAGAGYRQLLKRIKS